MTTASGNDREFGNAIAELYARYLVPMIFEPYARVLAERVAGLAPARVLEIAAGTGVVTRALVAHLPASSSIVATDLNPAMLAQARRTGTERAVEWRVADAMSLPFDDSSFDAVACQFGVMFFPDRPRAFTEMKRVLRPGGALLFSVWDGMADNEFAECVEDALGEVFPDDPPHFMSRTPHGYWDPARIARDLRAAGFTAPPVLETIVERSRAESPMIPAMAYCQGTPFRNEIVARRPDGLDHATRVSAEHIARRFGTGAIEGKIQATLVTVLA